jgi:hypothetical protein
MNKTKLNIILDLDQTIISAESSEEYDKEKNKRKEKKFIFHNMDNYYTVFERPGLQIFLDYLFKNFNVSVWTAASKDYALFIIDKIILQNKKERHLDWVFFSYHCDLSRKLTKRSKSLSMLWDVYQIDGYTKDNTIILDDYDEVFKTQEDNCIIAIPFEFEDKNSHKDNYLKKLENALKTITPVKPAKKINKQLNTI